MRACVRAYICPAAPLPRPHRAPAAPRCSLSHAGPPHAAPWDLEGAVCRANATLQVIESRAQAASGSTALRTNPSAQELLEIHASKLAASEHELQPKVYMSQTCAHVCAHVRICMPVRTPVPIFTHTPARGLHWQAIEGATKAAANTAALSRQLQYGSQNLHISLRCRLVGRCFSRSVSQSVSCSHWSVGQSVSRSAVGR